MLYRNDINGLRAVAVIAVILFHFNDSLMPGGFVGVDVFFVISGFLMTGIIFRGFEQKNFVVLKFYIARANRIIPALAILCITLLLLGWLFITPIEYKILSQHVGSSLSFISNIIYWKEVGYFDAASNEKWLLHTWSLSVEWQFYLIYPLVLVGLRKLISLKKLKLTILCGTVLGFIFCIIVTNQWPNFSYYILPTRVWEMTIGGVAYLYPFYIENKQKKLFEIFGLILIISSCFFISKESPWPGYLSFFPVLGTFFIIQANCRNSFFTSNLLFQKLGTWSYSIYLWHWVIVVANVKYGLELSIVMYIFSSILLGCVSYYLFERRVTNKTMLLLITATLITSSFVFFTEGGASRVNEKFQLDKKQFHRNYYGGSGYAANKLIYLNSSEDDYDLFFVGDSFGLQYAKTIDDGKIKVAGLFDHGCLIFPNYGRFIFNREDLSCSEEYEKLKTELKKNNKSLLLAYIWDGYKDKMIKKGGTKVIKSSVEEFYNLIQSELNIIFNENGLKRKYFIIGVPQRALINTFECLSRSELLGFKLFSKCAETQKKKEVKINSMLNNFSNEYPNVYFIDPNDFLCDEKDCLLIKNKEPIHSDLVHLSVFGASIVFDGIQKHVFDK